MLMGMILMYISNSNVEGALLEEMKLFFHFFSLVICIFIPRECNQVVHNSVKNMFLFIAFQCLGRG